MKMFSTLELILKQWIIYLLSVETTLWPVLSLLSHFERPALFQQMVWPIFSSSLAGGWILVVH